VPSLGIGLVAGLACAVMAQAQPRIDSVYPAGGRAGGTIQAVVRGGNLKGAGGIWFEDEGASGRVVGIETEKAPRRPADLVSVEITLAERARGSVSFRVLAAGGVSNALRLHVHEERVQMEGEGVHDLPEKAQKIAALPVAVHGRISEPGEVDYYSFRAEAGEEWWFRTKSSEALDPALAIYQIQGSWFDSGRAVRLAFHDEPVSYPDLTTEATLRYRFERAGEYLVRVNGFWGHGGPGQEYILLINKGGSDPDTVSREWKERTWTRRLETDRMDLLQGRALAGKKQPAVTVVEADGEPVKAPVEPQKITLPALVTGTIERPGDVDRVRLAVKEGERVVFEVETPGKTLPLMNPLLRIVDGDGVEALTNILSVVNSNGNLSKQIHPKTQYVFPRAGEFTLEIRDITAVYGDAEMKYRVLVRPQVPHVGEVHVAEDRLNLVAGKVQKLSVVTDQEEGFDGYVIVSMEGAPAGVRVVAGTEVEPDSPPSQSVGKRERFTSKKQKATLILIPDAGAPVTAKPVRAGIYAQPVVKGEMGAKLHVKDVWIMVMREGT